MEFPENPNALCPSNKAHQVSSCPATRPAQNQAHKKFAPNFDPIVTRVKVLSLQNKKKQRQPNRTSAMQKCIWVQTHLSGPALTSCGLRGVAFLTRNWKTSVKEHNHKGIFSPQFWLGVSPPSLCLGFEQVAAWRFPHGLPNHPVTVRNPPATPLSRTQDSA